MAQPDVRRGQRRTWTRRPGRCRRARRRDRTVKIGVLTRLGGLHHWNNGADADLGDQGLDPTPTATPTRTPTPATTRTPTPTRTPTARRRRRGRRPGRRRRGHAAIDALLPDAAAPRGAAGGASAPRASAAPRGAAAAELHAQPHHRPNDHLGLRARPRATPASPRASTATSSARPTNHHGRPAVAVSTRISCGPWRSRRVGGSVGGRRQRRELRLMQVRRPITRALPAVAHEHRHQRRLRARSRRGCYKGYYNHLISSAARGDEWGCVGLWFAGATGPSRRSTTSPRCGSSAWQTGAWRQSWRSCRRC